MKIIWSPLSLERVEEIASYIAKDNLTAAARWIEAIFNKTEKIGKLPLSGRVVPEMNKQEIREILYGNYRIIYRRDQKLLFVLTVRHCKQLLPLEDIDD
jgi:plasmid stabilization system protein ParE